MPVKFNQYWRVDGNSIEPYENFIMKDFIPGMNKLGIHVVAGWSVLVGGYSEILLEGASSDLDKLESALKNPKYRDLNILLQNHITNYKTKVLIQYGTHDTYTTDFEENTVKFIQMWDIVSSRKQDYDKFVTETYKPLLEDLGIFIAGEWEVLIGEGPRILCEGRAPDGCTLLVQLQSEKYRRAKRELKRYVVSYESRLLTFHIKKVKGYKSASYRLVSY